MIDQKYIYYCGGRESLNQSMPVLEPDYALSIWAPKIWQLAPRGLASRAFLGWGIFHFLRIFKRQDFKVFLIYYKGKEVANYTAVLPKYFKTPFMGNNDLQIGPVGTSKNHQRKGLASFAISKILEFYKSEDINFWYVARQENEPSLRLIEKIGFKKYGEGIKKGVFKKFVIETLFNARR